MLGQRVGIQVSGLQSGGNYTITFDAANLSWSCSVSVGRVAEIRKMLLLK